MKALDSLYIKMNFLLRDMVENEEGAVDIVAIVVLIGIAVILALFFRTQLEEIIRDLFKGISSNVKKSQNPMTSIFIR